MTDYLGRIEPPKGKFPFLVFSMLEDASDRDFDHIVSWQDDGKAFTIKDENLFEKQVIPMYFKHNQLRSFTRQLNIWGIRRLFKGKNTWHHPCLQKGEKNLLLQIFRKPNKGKRRKQEGFNINLESINETNAILPDGLREQKPRIPSLNNDEKRPFLQLKGVEIVVPRRPDKWVSHQPSVQTKEPLALQDSVQKNQPDLSRIFENDVDEDEAQKSKASLVIEEI